MSYSFTTIDNSTNATGNQLLAISDSGLISGIYGVGPGETGFTLAPPYELANYSTVTVTGAQYVDPFGVNDFGTIGGLASNGLFVDQGGSSTLIVDPSALAPA